MLNDAPPPADPHLPRRALLIDVEPATAGLIGHWLGSEGWQVATGEAPASAPGAADQADAPCIGLVVLEVAFPRRCARERIDALAGACPGAPLLVLSPTFFADVPARGEVARQIGATAVLATPLTRERLVATVRDLAPQEPRP